jgi:hypothetical protein
MFNSINLGSHHLNFSLPNRPSPLPRHSPEPLGSGSPLGTGGDANGSDGSGGGQSPSGEESGRRKQRRYRTTFSTNQLEELEKVNECQIQ